MSEQDTPGSPPDETPDLPADISGVQAQPDANDAGSSDAEKGADAAQAKQTLRDVVAAALKPKQQGDTPAPDKKVEPQPAEGAKPEVKDGSAEEPPFHKHPRWIEVQDRLKAETEVANEYRAIEKFAQANRLSTEDIVDGLQLLALVKTDPSQARDQIVKILEDIDNYTGVKLPKDLADQVEAGELTKEGATEISKARAREKHLTSRETARETEQQTANRQKQFQEFRTKVNDSIRAAEKDAAKTDTDYLRIKKNVLDRMATLAKGKKINSPEAGVALWKQAYTEVRAEMKDLLPPPKEKRFEPSKPGGGGAAPTAPKTLMDAVNAGLAQSRG